MLKLADEADKPAPSTPGGMMQIDNAEIERLLSAARRQVSVVIACSLIGLVVGIAYVMTAVPQYTAATSLLIDNRRVRAVQDAYDVMQMGLEGASAVDSQVEVVKSDSVALAVVEKLQLDRDPEFNMKPKPGLLATVMTWFWTAVGLPPPEVQEYVISEAEKHRMLADQLRANVDARRVPRTLVLEIQYRSADPDKAARFANAFADAYLFDQLEAKYDATRRASQWLQDRMAELKHQVLTTDLAVQKFKADNDLISSGGKLVSEQQLTEVNSQLVSARADVSRAEARYERIKIILGGHQTDALVTEAIGNQIIEQLRSKFVNAAKREAELSARLGGDHGSVISLRMEMREYERLMFEELGRISEAYRSELDIARAREKSLRESLAGLVGTAVSANETLVALRELEREAESYRNLYQSFLQRYQEVVQQQSFPITDARVILAAQRPFSPSHPRKFRMIMLAMVLGGGFGVALGALREFRERSFRTGDQVRRELGFEFLGMLPVISSPTKAALQGRGAGTGGERSLSRPQPVMRYVLDHPLSGFAETLRAVKIAADLTITRPVKVIGVVSVLPGEGKSTVAKNLASLLAHLGTRTLLIDADLRNPRLTTSVAPNAKEGIVEAVLKGKPVRDLVLREDDSSLALLPAAIGTRIPHTSEFLASAGMKSVLRQAADDYDCVVVDLPPLGAVVDARAMAAQIDGFLVVVEWGKTARRLVRSMIGTEHQISERCLGVVLNKVYMSALKYYESYGFKDYYHSEYGSYYQDKR